MSDHQPTNKGKPEATFALEAERPLSQSILWQLQRHYFERSGLSAWSEGTVPMYATSNPFVAHTYAHAVGGFLRDWTAGDHDAQALLNPDQPLYIIEVGAGTGRFAFHFLNELARRQEVYTGTRPANIKYIMTEYNESLLDFWSEHPALKPFIESGRLDFAHFDAERPADLELRISNRTLLPDGCVNPVIVLANYFFDSIPQDAFYLDDGQLYESRVALHSSQPNPDFDAPDLFDHLTLVYRRQGVTGDYYGNAPLDALLDHYRQEYSGTGLAFPNKGLGVIQYFQRLSSGRLLLLTCDKGYHRSEDVKGRREPGFEAHGSFSMGVNYHAIGQFFRMQGGRALHAPQRHIYLDVCAFLLGQPAQGYTETSRSFDESVGEFGPEDFFLVQSILDKVADSLSVEQVLGMLRLSRWDGRVFQTCFSSLLANLGSASDLVVRELRSAIDHLWNNYYYIGEEYDLPYDLGVILYKLGEYEAALQQFGHSQALHGTQAKTLFNMGLCHYCMQDREAALKDVVKAAELDPEFEPARAMARKLLAGLADKS